LGVELTPILNSNFRITVEGGGENKLRLLQYGNALDGLKTDEEDFNTIKNTATTEIDYVYTNDLSNSLILVFDKTTDIGVYKIKIWHESNTDPLKVVDCIVYNKATTTDFNLSVETDDYNFKNLKDDGSYKYSDYICDYIVAKGSTVKAEIEVNQSVLDSELIYDYLGEPFDLGSKFDGKISEYISVIRKGNKLELSFLQDTYINENCYITLCFGADVSICTTKEYNGTIFSSIVEKETGTEPCINTVTFFVYEKVDESNLKLDKEEIVLYYGDSNLDDGDSSNNSSAKNIGYYNNSDTTKTLSLFMGETNLTETELWNYTDKNVDWFTIDSKIETGFNKNGNLLTLHYTSEVNASKFVVYAEITQFGIPYRKQCNVTLNWANLTERIVITSPIGIDANDEYYLDIEVGSSKQITANHISSNGTVTHPGLQLVVVDSDYAPYPSIANISEDGTIEIVKNATAVAGLKLIVLSEDLLCEQITTATEFVKNGIIDITSSLYIKKNGGSKYKDFSYVIINLHVTDGKDVPYVIDSAEDFVNIAMDEHKKDKNFIVMQDIDLSYTSITIDEFIGKINTFNNAEFVISGVKLNNDNVNLFTNFGGEISNLHFVVEYGYNNISATEEHLGIFDINLEGVLTNVGAEVSGFATVSENEVKFGLLVAENAGEIKYTRISSSVYGSITLKGEGSVQFGLVGHNTSDGKIESTYSGNSNSSGGTGKDVVFVSNSGNDGTIANIKVTSEISSADLGLIVGYNQGNIKNCHVKGSITHSGAGNIGGAIGQNKFTAIENIYKFESGVLTQIAEAVRTVAVENVKSAVVISANSSVVGGVAGKDEGGVYVNCHYQIISNKTYITGGDYVGGILGQTKDAFLKYCSVMSYRWNYSDLNSITDDPDITSENGYVGGLIGYVDSTASEYSGELALKTTAVYLCSVNAYILGKNVDSYGLIGARYEDQTAVALNAYFIGAIDRKSEPSSPVLNSNIIYAVTKGNANLINPTAGFDITTYRDDNWGKIEGLNGEYIFITEDGEYPIFEMSPTSISAEVWDKTDADYDPENKDIEFNKFSDTEIHLNYYKFKLDSTDPNYVNIKNELDARYNTYNILDIIDISYLPEALTNVQLNVEIVEGNTLIINGDKIIVKSAGKSVIKFSSAINPNVYCEITVFTTLPIGNVVLSESEDDTRNPIRELNIAVDKAKMIYAVSDGYKELKGINYYYETNKNIKLAISRYDSTVAQYVKFASFDSYMNVLSNPFSISAIESSTTPIHVVIIPFVEVDQYLIHMDTDPKQRDLIINTREGATNISLGSSESIVYPNDVTTITAFVTTDIQLDLDTTLKYVQSLKLNGTLVNKSDYLTCESTTYDEDKKLQTFVYKLKVSEHFALLETSSEISIKFAVVNQNDEVLATAMVNYTVLPQRINSIGISNYIRNGGTIDKIDVLKQGQDGLIIIDMAPYNGYFDYLEITDITGGEAIDFYQLLDKDGTITIQQSTSAKEGVGIRLNKYAESFNLANNKSKIYVKTSIDLNASTQTHTIKVAAFLNDGRKLIENTIKVQVQMLPSLKVEYLSPYGDVVATHNIGDSIKFQNNDIAKYIAKGVETYFRITPINATSYTIDPKLTATSQENVYMLKADGDVEILLSATADYGLRSETRGDKLTFKAVDFVVYNVWASPTTIDRPNEIYGNYGVDINILFDLEVAYNGDASLNSDIQAIVDDLNNKTGSKVSVLQAGIYNTGSFITSGIKDLTLNGNRLRVEKGNEDTKLKLSYVLYLNGETWELSGSGTSINYNKMFDLRLINRMSALEMKVIANEEDFINMASGEAYYILGNDLILDNYSPISPDIRLFDGNGRTITINGFASSQDQNAQYGLFKEIKENMTVMNLNVEYMNIGTINTNLSETDIRVSEYFDLARTSAGVEYQQVDFGGITPVNKGVITNCKVFGDLAVMATKVEQQSSEEIAFNIGGIVSLNESTGYISNSTNELRIVAQANIGGVAHTNKGVISSSTFNANDNKGLIYAYKTGHTTPIVVHVAGLVVKNENRISMSYVHVGSTEIRGSNKVGNMSSKNTSAGFVFENTGKIKDSYIQIYQLGLNHNDLYGFVYKNSGEISTSYSFISEGNVPNNVKLFAPDGTEGITDCIEIKIPDGQDGKCKGLYTLNYNDKFVVEEYKARNFTFGSGNKDATFKYDSGMLPRLAIEDEKVEYLAASDQIIEITYADGSKETLSGKDVDLENKKDIEKTVTTYYGLRNHVVTAGNKMNPETGEYEWTESSVTIELNRGSKENPYVIYNVQSWNEAFMTGSTEHYYRLARDIDFNQREIITQSMTFNGNLQGNSMILSNIRLFTLEAMPSIGLFKELIGTRNVSVTNSVRNLELQPFAVNAVKSEMVGTLAGLVQDFNLYNVSVKTQQSQIVIGANAVGGIAGVIRGNFDVDNISSNLSATSTRVVINPIQNIYLSTINNGTPSSNIQNVYYAGSLFGIVDGYKSGYNSIYQTGARKEDDSTTQSLINNAKVTGIISGVGETVGGAFGFVGELSRVTNVSVNIDDGYFAGTEYSGGVVGENRGVIINASFSVKNENAFAESSRVSGGIVALNFGGFIRGAYSDAAIINNVTLATTGGIVGRNILGYVHDSSFNGKTYSYFTGGIIGTDYTAQLWYTKTAGAGSITADCKDVLQLDNLSVQYDSITNRVDNIAIGIDAVNYYITKATDFYGYEIDENATEIEFLGYAKVMGLYIGMTNDLEEYDGMSFESIDDKGTPETSDDETNMYLRVSKTAENYLKMNLSAEKDKSIKQTELSTGDTNHIDLYQISHESTAVMLLIGAEVTNMDSWSRTVGYLNDYVLYFKTAQ